MLRLGKVIARTRLQVLDDHIYWDGQPIAQLMYGSGNQGLIRNFKDRVLDLDRAIQLREEFTNLYTELKLTTENLRKIAVALTQAEAGTPEHSPFFKDQ